MKKTNITLLFALLATGLYAQDLVYTHNANGNRIVRETILLKTAQPGNGSATAAQDVMQEEENRTSYILGSRVTVYPNPTQGALQVDIDLPEEIQEARLLLLNSNGQRV